MSMRQPVTQPMTIDEFLVWRGEEDMLWELVEGYPVLRDGPTGMTSRSHGRLIGNMTVALATRLRASGKPCIPEIGSEFRSGTKSNLRLPDILVRCGTDRLTAEDPRVAVEILSPANSASEMARKREEYAAAGILEIVEVDQDRPFIWVYRPDGNVWHLETVRGMEGTLRLSSLGLEVPMAEIYGDVALKRFGPSG